MYYNDDTSGSDDEVMVEASESSSWREDSDDEASGGRQSPMAGRRRRDAADDLEGVTRADARHARQRVELDLDPDADAEEDARAATELAEVQEDIEYYERQAASAPNPRIVEDNQRRLRELAVRRHALNLILDLPTYEELGRAEDFADALHAANDDNYDLHDQPAPTHETGAGGFQENLDAAMSRLLPEQDPFAFVKEGQPRFVFPMLPDGSRAFRPDFRAVHRLGSRPGGPPAVLEAKYGPVSRRGGENASSSRQRLIGQINSWLASGVEFILLFVYAPTLTSPCACTHSRMCRCACAARHSYCDMHAPA